MKLTPEKKASYEKYIKGLKTFDKENRDLYFMDWAMEFCENNDMCEEFILASFNPIGVYAICKVCLKEDRGETVDYDKLIQSLKKSKGIK